MADTSLVDTIPHLERLGNVVPDGYSYSQKLVIPGKDISLPGAYLKWYDVRRPDVEFARELVEESRAFVAAEVERLKIQDELGFVLLHDCKPTLLLIMTWRNINEIWETAYAKNMTQAAGYQPIPYETIHRGTFCVWELGAVWHERQAWVRFLSSQRDEAAKLAYINDRFSGLV